MSDAAGFVCLTFDFDGVSIWIGSFKSNNPSMISRGEFATIEQAVGAEVAATIAVENPRRIFERDQRRV
jgi:hypothetical protein